MTFTSLIEAWRALRSLELEGLSFEHPWVLALMVAIVPLAIVLRRRHTRAPFLVYARTEAVRALTNARFSPWVLVKDALLVVTLLVTGLALAHPRALSEPDPAEMEGIDIVVTLDVSGSMRAADFKPKDRLTVAKSVIADHLLSRTRDRVGLVVFAGEAFTQAPLTHDMALLHELLDGVKTGVITDGTAIGDAVATGVNRLRDSRAVSKVLILVTDGDNNAGNISPEKAAELAREFGVRIYPILVGKGGQVPYPSGNDFFGKTRYVYMTWPTNPELLKNMATSTNGAFFSAQDPAALEGSFKTILEELDRTMLVSGPLARRQIDLYPLLILVALFSLLLSFVLATTRASTVP
jgi:Ca-activated chloride channel family protein